MIAPFIHSKKHQLLRMKNAFFCSRGQSWIFQESQVQPYKVTCVKIQPFYSCIVKSRIYMCIRFYSCIVFTHAFWNVMNLSSGWQKLLNCLNYKKIKFQIILSNTMIIEFSRWWSSENIRKISQDLERFRKKIRRSETP